MTTTRRATTLKGVPHVLLLYTAQLLPTTLACPPDIERSEGFILLSRPFHSVQSFSLPRCQLAQCGLSLGFRSPRFRHAGETDRRSNKLGSTPRVRQTFHLAQLPG